MAFTLQAEIDLVNQATNRLGCKTDITLAGYASDPVGKKADLFFGQTRDALIRSYNWNFAETEFYMSRKWAANTDFIADQYAFAQFAAYAIATTTASTKTFTITSTVDISSYFPTDSTVTVFGSTGNLKKTVQRFHGT